MPRLVFAALASTIALALAGCSPMTLPGVQMDPQVPPQGGGGQPYAGTNEQGPLVQYYVNCRDCTMEYSTPNGPAVVEEVQGGIERRVRFQQQFAGSSLILNATPTEFGRVIRATITVDGRRVAEVEPSDARGAGTPVYLSATLGGERPR
jgi:hypothetical protein